MTAAAEGISVNAALQAVLSDQDGIFTIKEKHKDDTEGFSRWTTLFRFSPDWFWQELR